MNISVSTLTDDDDLIQTERRALLFFFRASPSHVVAR